MDADGVGDNFVSDKAAAGLAYLFGDAEPVASLMLHVVAQTNTTITLGWTPVPGAVGYRFSRAGYVKADGSPRYSTTFDPTTSSVKFAKAAWYQVEALGVVATDRYPPSNQPQRARVSWAGLRIRS